MRIACGKAEEKADETLVEKAIEASSGQHAEVDIADGQQTVTIETEEGTYVATSGDDVRLPEAALFASLVGKMALA